MTRNNYIITRYGVDIDLSKEGHVGCPKCISEGMDRSQNNLMVYGLQDGKHGGAHCFSCGWTIPSEEWLLENGEEDWDYTKELVVGLHFDDEVLKEIKESYEFIDESYRGIRSETFKYFGVMHKTDEDGGLVEQIYPTFVGSTIKGFKRRGLPKNFLTPYGETGVDVDFFGQFRFLKSNAREVVICAGEIDQLSAYQMLKDYRDRTNKIKNTDYPYTPVVSSTVGEGGTATQCREQYEWLNRFDKIIVCMDNDKAGKEAIEKISTAIPKNKLFVMSLTLKDSNEYLKQGKESQFVDAFYKASPYVPIGVVGSSKLSERIREHAKIEKIPLPSYMHRLQKMMAGGIPLGVIVNLISSSGTGKCHGKGTPILMHDMSIKNVEDVKVGDKLMGVDGSPRIVKKLSTGFGNLYRVDQVKGDSYVVNENHVLSLKSNSDSKKYGFNKGDTVNIKILDYLNLPKWVKDVVLKGYKADLVNLSGNSNINNDDAYMLGLWLAEGHTDASRVTLNRHDKELGEFVDYFCKTKGYSLTIPPSTDKENSFTLTISGGYRGVLGEYGLLGNKHIPAEFMLSDYDIRLNLLAGLIDGDGYLTSNGYELTLKDNRLVDDIIKISRSVGLSATVRDKFSKCQNFEGEVYKRVFIYGDTDKIPNKLNRKKCTPRKQVKDSLVTGISVTAIGEGEYFGFEVDGDHLYCLGDFTVTHNSTHVEEIIYHWIFNSPYKVGILSLESDAGEYGTKLLSRHVGRKINLIESVEEKLAYLDSDYVKVKERELFWLPNEQDRFILMDDRDGKVEDVQEIVEEMIVKSDCKVIVIDPLQDLIACLPDDKQNEFMSWQKGLTKSHSVTFFNVNHTKKSLTGGGAGSQGVDMVEEDAHGSSSIYKSGACNLLFSRDKEAEDPIVRNTTIMKMSKCRWTGNTSPFAGKYYYDNETHTVHDYDDWMLKHPELNSF